MLKIGGHDTAVVLPAVPLVLVLLVLLLLLLLLVMEGALQVSSVVVNRKRVSEVVDHDVCRLVVVVVVVETLLREAQVLVEGISGQRS